jgi:hypothetical protein
LPPPFPASDEFIGAVNGGGCGSGLVVFPHHVAIQHGAAPPSYREPIAVALCFTLLQAFRVKEGFRTPANHPPTRISQRIHAEDETNSRKPIKGKRGWRRCLRPIVQSKLRQYGVWCGCRGSCRKRGWMWAAKRLVSPAWVVVGRERGCGRRNDKFQRLSEVPIVTEYELRGCESEMTGGVVISTPSPTHLTGLPHNGSPLQFSYPSTSIPLLQNLAHIPR